MRLGKQQVEGLGFPSTVLPDPGATNADGTLRVHPLQSEVLHTIGPRHALRDQAVGQAWGDMAARDINAKQQEIALAPYRPYGHVVPPSLHSSTSASTSLQQHFRSPEPPLPVNVDLGVLASWKPPLATAAGVDGVPYTGRAPEVPRSQRFRAVSYPLASIV